MLPRRAAVLLTAVGSILLPGCKGLTIHMRADQESGSQQSGDTKAQWRAEEIFGIGNSNEQQLSSVQYEQQRVAAEYVAQDGISELVTDAECADLPIARWVAQRLRARLARTPSRNVVAHIPGSSDQTDGDSTSQGPKPLNTRMVSGKVEAVFPDDSGVVVVQMRDKLGKSRDVYSATSVPVNRDFSYGFRGQSAYSVQAIRSLRKGDTFAALVTPTVVSSIFSEFANDGTEIKTKQVAVRETVVSGTESTTLLPLSPYLASTSAKIGNVAQAVTALSSSGRSDGFDAIPATHEMRCEIFRSDGP